MKKLILVCVLALLLSATIAAKKMSRSRSSSSSRGSSRKTASNPQPASTSLSNPQPSASKPSFSGWETKPNSHASSGQSHSYPSSQTGLSGSNKPHQESAQKTHTYPQNSANQQGTNTQTANHGYPSSGGLSGQGTGSQQQGSLSGSSAQGSKSAPYPQSPTGLSGSNSPNYPQQHGGLSGSPSHSAGGPPNTHNSGVAPPPYPGYSGQGYPNNNYHHPQPPPPYSPSFGPGYGGQHYGGHGHNPGYGSQNPGYFGNYNNYGKGFGGVSRPGSTLRGVGIAGAGIGTVLTGLALWNLARSTGNRHHTVIYDNRGQPVAVAPENGTVAETDSMLSDLVNCTLTIENGNETEVLAIPCAIATSFSPNAKVEDLGENSGKADNTKCTITVVTKKGEEYMTSIPCSTLLNTAAENNVTEPMIVPDEPITSNTTVSDPIIESKLEEPTALPLAVNKNISCEIEAGAERDPINPCFAVESDLSVIPLSSSTTPAVA